MQDNKNNNNDQGGVAPFVMGVAIGVAGAVTYAAARKGKLGGFVEDKVHGFEDKAVGMKDAMVNKVATTGRNVAKKLHLVSAAPAKAAAKAKPKKAKAAAKPKTASGKAA